ncbi:hypothetical protein [Halostagnicola sp. A-GB9-2]|uniref:DUF7289 family protein n=1 Tax=Halostagnicola sp. A-GB9-2 TaxID=3048066 RepID=UPI0024C000D1|nr:hypothetical protein [Halostagnicola sp. A-GB9-2]MDJ1430694.1 hypothetical protein [Halostagnicola sp. A-GB9-2]
MKRTRNERSGRRDERAVTELVSFVLVFGTIVLSVAVVSIVGFQAIQIEQEHEQFHLAERAVDDLSNDFNDILRIDGVSQRDNELAVSGQTIAPGEPGPRLEVAIDHAGGTDTESWRLGSFVYGDDSHAVAYEGGGVFRTSETGKRTSLVEPRIQCEDETAIVSVVKIKEDNRAVQSNGVVSVTATETESYRETFFNVNALEIDVETARSSDRGWERAFDGWTETGDSWTCTGSEGAVVDSLSVHVVTIDIDYATSV